MEEIKKQLIVFGWLFNTYTFIENGKIKGKCEVAQSNGSKNPSYTKLYQYTANSEREAFIQGVSYILDNCISYAKNSVELYRLFGMYKKEI